jgi:capsular exopolysaccharide synthesis family protein
VTRFAEAIRRSEELADDRIAGGLAIPGTTAESSPQAVQIRPDEDLDVFQRFSSSMAGQLVVMPEVPPSAVEQYRRLAASLHHVQMAKDTSVVMITSASPGEGKTLTATNLALTLSESYRRKVLLIDADLRKPSVHERFQVPNSYGLSDALKSSTEEKLALIDISEHLAVLTAGRPDSDPMSGLTSDRMRRILQDAASCFDWVIVDTPPVGFLSDANLLVAMVDVAIFIVRAGKSPYRLIQRALDAVGRDRILGVVLNAIDESDDVAGYNYYGYYGYAAPRRVGGKP